jgi:hypothetical protein
MRLNPGVSCELLRDDIEHRRTVWWLMQVLLRRPRFQKKSAWMLSDMLAQGLVRVEECIRTLIPRLPYLH